MSALRQARLDADTRRTRLAGVEDRARFFADEVAKLDREIAASPSNRHSGGQPGGLCPGVRLGKLRELRDRTQDTVDLYRRVPARSRASSKP